jgi:hypothetical protein
METSHSESLTLFTIRKELMELEDKPKDEVPPTDQVPTTSCSTSYEALLSRLEKIEQAITEAGKNQVDALINGGKMHLNAVKAEALYNAEAHADTQKLINDLWDCEIKFLKQLDCMIKERFIFSKSAKKDVEDSVLRGEKETRSTADISRVAEDAKNDSETAEKEPSAEQENVAP